MDAGCPLCNGDGGTVLHRDDALRVIVADEPGLPGFLRVVWNAHVAEMTDLAPPQRARLMDVVWQVEAALRETLSPDKINLASLGNQVPHLHWHLVPRWRDDRWFPAPVWAAPLRAQAGARSLPPAEALAALRASVIRRLA